MATKSEVERLAVVETKIDTLILEVREMKNNFAAKWVQTVVAGFLAAVFLAFAYAVINFFIPPKHAVVAEPKTSQTTVKPSTTTNITNTTTPSPAPQTTNSSGGLLEILPKL